MKKRKAQSDIITTVLIILLVLAAIVILWQVVSGMIKKASENVDMPNVNLEITHVYLNPRTDPGTSDDTLDITVHRLTGKGDITALKFILEDGTGTTYSYEENRTAYLPKELETYTYVYWASHFSSLPNFNDIKKVSLAYLGKTISGKVVLIPALTNPVAPSNVGGGGGGGGGTYVPLPTCTCVGKTCGDDGCGVSCGTCTSPKTCNNYQCCNANDGGTCSVNGDCCSNNCNTNHCCPTGEEWNGTSCKVPATCSSQGQDCSTTSCCTGLSCSSLHCCPTGSTWDSSLGGCYGSEISVELTGTGGYIEYESMGSTYTKITSFGYIGYPSPGTTFNRRSWARFNLNSAGNIPDNSQITDALFNFIIDSLSNPPGINFYSMELDPNTASNLNIYKDAGNGTNYFSCSPSSCMKTGTKLIDLGTTADSNIEIALTGNDEFSVGLSNQSGIGYYDLSSPNLTVKYKVPA